MDSCGGVCEEGVTVSLEGVSLAGCQKRLVLMLMRILVFHNRYKNRATRGSGNIRVSLREAVEYRDCICSTTYWDLVVS